VPTHQILLESGVIALETVDLSAVPAGAYELVCLPLKISGAEGAPARAILISS
jgi:arylformamidase